MRQNGGHRSNCGVRHGGGGAGQRRLDPDRRASGADIQPEIRDLQIARRHAEQADSQAFRPERRFDSRRIERQQVGEREIFDAKADLGQVAGAIDGGGGIDDIAQAGGIARDGEIERQRGVAKGRCENVVQVRRQPAKVDRHLHVVGARDIGVFHRKPVGRGEICEGHLKPLLGRRSDLGCLRDFRVHEPGQRGLCICQSHTGVGKFGGMIVEQGRNLAFDIARRIGKGVKDGADLGRRHQPLERGLLRGDLRRGQAGRIVVRGQPIVDRRLDRVAERGLGIGRRIAERTRNKPGGAGLQLGGRFLQRGNGVGHKIEGCVIIADHVGQAANRRVHRGIERRDELGELGLIGLKRDADPFEGVSQVVHICHIPAKIGIKHDARFQQHHLVGFGNLTGLLCLCRPIGALVFPKLLIHGDCSSLYVLAAMVNW